LIEYLEEGSVHPRNIAAAATEGAPGMVGRYRGFATLLKENILYIYAVHFLLHREFHAAKKLSGNLRDVSRCRLHHVSP